MLQKNQKKKVAIYIRETCEKAMFTPSNSNKATYKSYCYCLAIRMLPNCQYNLATLDCQIVSKNLAISFRRTKNDDLAIKEAKSLAIK
jgi:hypothetical protein